MTTIEEMPGILLPGTENLDSSCFGYAFYGLAITPEDKYEGLPTMEELIEKGLKPDIEVADDPATEEDEQLEAAIEELQNMKK